jgi:hypothetical protein
MCETEGESFLLKRKKLERAQDKYKEENEVYKYSYKKAPGIDTEKDEDRTAYYESN